MMLGLLLAAAVAAEDHRLHAEIRRDAPGLVLIAANRTARNLCFHLPSTDSAFHEANGQPIAGDDTGDPPLGVQVVWADGLPHEYAVTGGLIFEAKLQDGTVTASTTTLEFAVYDCRALLSHPWRKAKPLFTRHIEVPQ